MFTISKQTRTGFFAKLIAGFATLVGSSLGNFVLDKNRQVC